jgi:hypothetical protein
VVQAGDAGQTEEAESWRGKAEAHAADFWLTIGGEPSRAILLARQNLALRPTPRARALLRRACDQADHRSRPGIH